MKPKKIAIVHDFLVRFGGAEQVVKAWAAEFEEADIFTLFYDEKMNEFFDPERVKTSFLQRFYKYSKGKYTWMLPLMPWAISSFKLDDYDLIISSSAAFSHGVKTSNSQQHISYVHSPARWAWDWHDKFMLERKMHFLTKALFKSVIRMFRKWDVKTSKNPTKILAVSNVIKERIKKYWNKESEVVYPFANDIFFEEVEANLKQERRSYMLVVSQLVPYKKVDLIIEACLKLGQELVIVGDGIEKQRLIDLAHGSPLVKFEGAKYGSELIKYFDEAAGFIFAGEDDFGITPVEAMARGLGVVAYNRGGATETVVSGKTGVFFEEQTVDGIVEAIEKFKGIKFNEDDCKKKAKLFTRTRHIEQLHEIISAL
jgi:glycosyltransferase involved in cell wall biosynthesis